MTEPIDFVAARIVTRYSHPSRSAYAYMFRLKPGTDLGGMTPSVESIITAWVDEGEGLIPSPPEIAVDHCRIAQRHKPDADRPRQMTPHERRQMMARAILFTVSQPSADLVTVHLVSRSVCFSPKGDREAHEQWRRTGEGWYSAHVPRD